MKNELIKAMIIVFTSFVASAIIMIFMKKIAKHLGAMDMPREEEEHRHIHKKATPKLGAVGIYLAFLIGFMLFGEQSTRMNSILIATFIIILTGISDDIKSIRARNKLLGHIIAASIIVFYGKILLTGVQVFGFIIDFGLFAYPLTILFLVACTNIISLIDGLDGLSGGICTIFYISVLILGFFQWRMGTLVMILGLIMLGSTLGFLVHNFYPASIFAGDCVGFEGFMIGIITLLEFKGLALISFFIPVAILGVPILDTLFAIIRRLLKGQPPFKADKEHLHHQLLGMHLSQRTAVLVIYLIELLFAGASLLYVLADNSIYGLVLYGIITVIVIWFVLHTSIISENSKTITKSLINRIKNIINIRKTRQ